MWNFGRYAQQLDPGQHEEVEGWDDPGISETSQNLIGENCWI